MSGLTIFDVIGRAYTIFCVAFVTILVLGPAIVGLLRSASFIASNVRVALRDCIAKMLKAEA
jgi:hypothetical protein